MIFCVFIFLVVSLYLDVFKYFIGSSFRVGLPIVPIQLLAHLFLGIYVALSIWYKLSDRTLMGAYVSVGGALLTVGLLFWWVPRYGYTGAAYATLSCYFSMALVSYLLGRKYYPVPYDVPRILAYIALGLLLYFGNGLLIEHAGVPALLSGTLGIALFLAVAYAFDGRKLRAMA